MSRRKSSWRPSQSAPYRTHFYWLQRRIFWLLLFTRWRNRQRPIARGTKWYVRPIWTEPDESCAAAAQLTSRRKATANRAKNGPQSTDSRTAKNRKANGCRAAQDRTRSPRNATPHLRAARARRLIQKQQATVQSASQKALQESQHQVCSQCHAAGSGCTQRHRRRWCTPSTVGNSHINSPDDYADLMQQLAIHSLLSPTWLLLDTSVQVLNLDSPVSSPLATCHFTVDNLVPLIMSPLPTIHSNPHFPSVATGLNDWLFFVLPFLELTLNAFFISPCNF